MLELLSVSLAINGHAVLSGIDLAVVQGELVVVIGPSGVGKTSLLRMAAGLIAPTAGRRVNGFRRLATVFQEPRLLPWRNALDNVALVLEAVEPDTRLRRERARQWLLRLGLGPLDIAKYPLQLSGGMQARVAIARAFAIAPDLVLMDEPFAALDFGLRRDLQNLTRALIEETGVAGLFVTHDLLEAVRLADRIVVLHGRPGRVSIEFRQTPVAGLAQIWDAASALSRRPELAGICGGLSTSH